MGPIGVGDGVDNGAVVVVVAAAAAVVVRPLAIIFVVVVVVAAGVMPWRELLVVEPVVVAAAAVVVAVVVDTAASAVVDELPIELPIVAAADVAPVAVAVCHTHAQPSAAVLSATHAGSLGLSRHAPSTNATQHKLKMKSGAAIILRFLR